MQDESCFRDRKGLAESFVHGRRVDRNLYHEHYRRDHLRDSGKLRGGI